MNVIILANEKDHNPPKDEGGGRKNSFNRGMQDSSFFAADTGAGMARWLMDSSDYIVQMTMDSEKKVEMIELVAGQAPQRIETDTGRLVRRLRLGYHPNYAAGARVDFDPNKPLPDFIDGNTPKELYDNFRKEIQ